MKKFAATAISLAAALLAAGVGSAFTVTTGADGSFLSWPEERTAIFYRIGTPGLPVSPEAVGEMGRAFAEWEEKSRGEIAFICEGQVETSRAVRDGHNTMVWVSRAWPYGPEIAAVSTLWPAEEPGRIAEVDIEFNARDYEWDLPGASGLAETALHEIGHLLGIGHSFNPGAVMHHLRYPGLPPPGSLSRDDLEALVFLYPRRERKVFQYDLPVLFYPRSFPGESPILPPASGLSPAGGRWITALGSIDLTGDGYLSELLTAVRDGEGGKRLSGWEPDPGGENRFRRLGPARQFSPAGEILGLAGVDYDRDGISGEAAVLVRDGVREKVYISRLDRDDAGPANVLSLAAAPANNLVGLAALDAAGSGFREDLLLLRAYPGRYSLFLHRIPREGETVSLPDPGAEIPLPGLQDGSRLLGLAVLDAEGSGRERDLVVLELTPEQEYWLHLFSLNGPSESDLYDVSYQTSSRLPSPPAAVRPGRITGLDLNRDGFYNQLIIHGPEK